MKKSVHRIVSILLATVLLWQLSFTALANTGDIQSNDDLSVSQSSSEAQSSSSQESGSEQSTSQDSSVAEDSSVVEESLPDTSNSSSSDEIVEDIPPTIQEENSEDVEVEEFEYLSASVLKEDSKLILSLNLDSVNVSLQWQKRLITETDTDLSQNSDECSVYFLPIEGMTEEQLLEINPEAAWVGKEMWDTAVAAAGGDTSIHIENGTPLDTLANSETQWIDIENANNAEYEFESSTEYTYLYRCVVNIEDEEYVLKAQEAAQKEIALPTYIEEDENGTEVQQEVPQPTAVINNEVITNEIEVRAVTKPSFFSMFRSSPSVSLQGEWLTGVTRDMEYITKDAYDRYGASAIDNAYWTKLAGGTRADGTTYVSAPITKDAKMPLLSAWYGKTIYVRTAGSSGQGTAIDIPAYTDINYTTGEKTLYKKVVSVLSVRVPETGVDFYSTYIDGVIDQNQNLRDGDGTAVLYSTAPLTPNNGQYSVCFNTNPERYLYDAEGNYRFDCVMIGVNVYVEPDLSGKAAWELKKYITEGYGFMTGHDMIYGYGGVTSSSYVPDKNSTVTPYYVMNTSTNGHWNMNWLAGVNKMYTEANPYEAASMVLCNGNYLDKSTLYGDNYGLSTINVKTVVQGNPDTDVNSRVPTNYPYDSIVVAGGNMPLIEGAKFETNATHSNQQMAYGTIWLDFASNSLVNSGLGKLITDARGSLTGTNNFYLTTNGNIALNQIGHRVTGQAAGYAELQLFANTVMYISQRQQCQVCQSEQGNNKEIHFVHRISSAEQLEYLKDQEKYWYTYPMDGCYILTKDIQLPGDWTPIEGFYGHFHANGYTVNLGANGKPLFANTTGIKGEYASSATRGWNLGADNTSGLNSIVGTSNQRTTGVARISGYLGDLFGQSNTLWTNKIVVVEGSDGEKYWCKTNSDGKYVISNTPTTGVMVARVYNTDSYANISSANEVAQYGRIRVNVPTTFWNTDETTVLYLLGENPIPVENRTVYIGQTANFVEGGMYCTVPVTNIKWEYKTTLNGSWTAIEIAPFSYEIEAPVFHDYGEDSYTLTSIKVNDCLEEMTGYYFRAALTTPSGKTVYTSDASTPTKSGLLTVLPRPAYVKQAADKEVWAGETVEYTTTFEYWKNMADGVTVQWQYQETVGGAWKDVTSTTFDFTVGNSVGVGTENPDVAPHKITSTLTINDVSRYWSQYHFRTVYTYNNGTTSTSWKSNDYDKTDFTGLLVVLQPRVEITNPKDQQVTLLLGQSVSSETATYTSTITYSPSVGKPTVNWNYTTTQNAIPNVWTQEAATALYPTSGIRVEITNSDPVPVLGQVNTFAFTSTMKITNAPIAMDYGTMQYSFNCTAVTPQNNLAASTYARLSIVYPIDIKHNEPTSVKNADGSATFTYPNLTVKAPEGVKLRTLMVQFSSGNVDLRDVISYRNLPTGTTVVGDQYSYIFRNSTGLTAEQWQTWLRNNTSFKVYENKVDVYWYIDENYTGNNIYYNSSNGHFYELMSFSSLVEIRDARTTANSKTFLGLSGYLATITTASERESVRRLTQGMRGGLGGSQWPTITGGNGHDWFWIDGPEKGIAFYHQNSLAEFAHGGYPLNEMYNSWAEGEPYNGFGSGGRTDNAITYGVDNMWRAQGIYSTLWVVEYGGMPGQIITRTNQNAFDIDTVGTGFMVLEANVTITAQDSIYDGAQHGATFTITGATLTQGDINTIKAGAVLTYLYADGTWSTTKPKDTGTYTAKVTFNAAVKAKYKLPLETVCMFTIFPRGLFLYSYNNDKIYDGKNTGAIGTIKVEPLNAANGTGIVTGDTVAPSSTTVAGRYSTKNQTSSVQVTMERTGNLTLVNNAKSNYYIAKETYTGAINPRPLHAHSLYLDDVTTPRNIKVYDAATSATITDIILDNVVSGDTVSVNKAALQGSYANANAGEQLDKDGRTLPDRFLKLTENEITRSAATPVVLENNDLGNYYVATERYSGAIYRKTLDVHVPYHSAIYGDSFDTTFETLDKYTATNTGTDSVLILNGLEGADELTIDTTKSEFKFEKPFDKIKDVGMYVAEYTGLTDGNYDVLKNYVVMVNDGGINITPRTLTITVDGGYFKEQGKNNPNFDVVYDGFVYKDTPKNALTGKLKYDTSCGKDSPVFFMPDGETLRGYPVYANGLESKENSKGAKNYEIEWIAGDITVYQLSLDIKKSADKEVANIGETITYTLNITNTSSIDVKNVKVKDVNSGKGKIEAESTDKYIYKGDGVFFISNIARGETIKITYKYTLILSDEASIVKNSATAEIPGDPFDPVNPFNPEAPKNPDHIYPSNEVDVTVPSYSLEVTKQADKSFAIVGEKITYSIIIKNTSSIRLTDVVIKDTFTGSYEIEAIGSERYTYSGGGVFKIPYMEENETIKITYIYTTVAQDGGKTLKNVATGIIKEVPDRNYPSNEVQVEVITPDPLQGYVRVSRPATNVVVKDPITGEVLSYTLKEFPKTGITIENGTLEKEEKFIVPVGETPVFDMPSTLKHENKKWRLKDLLISRSDGLLGDEEETVVFNGLAEESVPQTYKVSNGARSYTLYLSETTYSKSKASLIDVEYTNALAAPKVDETFIQEIDGVTTTYYLDELEQTSNFTWRQVEIPITYYGFVGYRFFAGNVEVPYSIEQPVYKGYEDTLLTLIGNSKNYRIVNSRWTDDKFVEPKKGDAYRRGVLIAEVFAADWTAHYKTADNSISATATYTANGNNKDIEYIAVGTYSKGSLFSFTPLTVVILLSGILLLVIGAILFLIVLAKKEEDEKEEVTN